MEHSKLKYQPLHYIELIAVWQVGNFTVPRATLSSEIIRLLARGYDAITTQSRARRGTKFRTDMPPFHIPIPPPPEDGEVRGLRGVGRIIERRVTLVSTRAKRARNF